MYDDATAQDCNPRGPNPTHWFPVPALPRHALDDAWPESPPHGATDIASLIGNPQDLIVRLLCSARDLELDEEIRLLCGESAVEIDRLVCRLERGA